jgi:hypothetical protein
MRPALPLYYYAYSRAPTEPRREAAAASPRARRRRPSLGWLFRLPRRPVLVGTPVAAAC